MKTPQPKLPWGKKPEKYGIGLSQLFPAKTLPPDPNAPLPDDELQTPMLPPPFPVPLTRKARKKLPPAVCPPKLERCPSCSGSTFEEFKRMDVPGYEPNATAKSSDFGVYRFVTCSSCSGRGKVSQDEAISIRIAMTQKSQS